MSLITLLGTIASGGPILSTDAEGQPECQFTLLVSGTACARLGADHPVPPDAGEGSGISDPENKRNHS